MEEIVHDLLGGSVTTRPAGKFVDQQKNPPEEIAYDDAVVVTVGRRSTTLTIPAARALYQSIRDNKDLQNALGLRAGLLS